MTAKTKTSTSSSHRSGNTPFERCIFLLLDGARPDILEELVARGKLPHIAETFFEKGEFRYATSVFPTTTGPAYFPFLTGCFPGTCNVPGIRWMDRKVFARGRVNTKAIRSYVGLESYLMNRDIPSDVETLFEVLRPSHTVFSIFNRGVSPAGNHTRLLRTFMGFYAKFSHHWSYMDRVTERLMLKAVRQRSRFLFTAFLGIDEDAHLSDPSSPRTLEAYARVDRSIGKLKAELARQGLEESTLLVASSDHGMTQTTKHLELWKVLEDKGYRTLYYPKIFRRDVRAACMISGNSMAHLYFRNGNSWGKPFPHNDLEKNGMLAELLSHTEIDHVITRQGEDAVVTSRKGQALIREKEGMISYRVKGGDPFGFEALPKEMTFEQSLEKTFRTNYPDAPLQVAQLFRSERTGDAIVSAANGYDLRDRHEIPEHFASHGSLHRKHMMVPLMFNTPIKNRRSARTVDVFPTILKLLGERVSNRIDGVSLS